MSVPDHNDYEDYEEWAKEGDKAIEAAEMERDLEIDRKLLEEQGQKRIDFSQYRHPRARSTDPATSHEAAAKLRPERQQNKLAKAVVRHPGKTARELAAITGLPIDTCTKRLPELRTIGRIYNGHTKKCTVTGRRAMTWWPTPELHDVYL